MKLTNEQLQNWWEIAVRFFHDPSFTVDRNRPIKKGDISGLKQGINDLLSGYSGDFELDRQLKAAGLPNFDEMERMLRVKENAILRRGRIRDDEELYIVKEVLAGALEDLSPKNVRKLAAMMTEYAKKPGANKPVQRTGAGARR